MGTSKSSSGSPSSVPMVPPWVPPVPGGIPDLRPSDGDSTPNEGETTPPNPQELPQENQPPPIAPKGRFGSSRRVLGNFARSGDSNSLKKSLGNYVRKGYGGASTAMRRMGKTISVAGALFSALSDLSSNDPSLTGTQIDPNLLRGKSSKEVMDAIIESICPSDGTQDSEAARQSANNAMSEMLTKFPTADQTNLTEEQKSFAIERFVANDVFQRFYLDVGKVIIDKPGNTSEGVARLKQVKDFIKQCVAAEFRRLRDASFNLTKTTTSQVVAAAIFQTFTVFESYL